MPNEDLPSDLGRSAGAGPTGTGPLSDAQAQALRAGTLLAGRYEVRDLLGAGGMGAVYRVHDRERRKDVALKVMLPSLLAREKAVERFAHEAEIMLGLSHEGIVRVFDVGAEREHRLRFYTMELLEGMSLRAWLDAKKRTREAVDPREALEITRQLLEALRYAHRVTVHRDLKPENVFLVADLAGVLRVKILDFGIAKLQSAAAFTSTSMALGTAYYMAPEQQLDAAAVDARADLYALSVMLYEMLTAELPIGAVKTPSAERRAKIEEWGGPPPAGAAALPRGIDDLVMSGLERRPDRRPETAERMLAEVGAIRTLLERSGAGAGARRAPPAAAIAAVLVFAASGIALAVLRPWERGAAKVGPKADVVPASGIPAAGTPSGADAKPPTAPVTFLALDPPASETALLREPAIHVRGRVSDPKAGPARIGEPGKPALEKPLDGEGRFDAVLGLDPGARAVEVRAGDALATIAVEIDALPPLVTLETPAEWRGGSLSVAAVVRAAHPRLVRFRLFADGKTAAPAIERPVGPDGRAAATIELAGKPTTIVVRVEAEDALGRTATAEREVKVAPPARPEAKAAALAARVIAAHGGRASLEGVRAVREKGRVKAGEGPSTSEARFDFLITYRPERMRATHIDEKGVVQTAFFDGERCWGETVAGVREDNTDDARDFIRAGFVPTLLALAAAPGAAAEADDLEGRPVEALVLADGRRLLFDAESHLLLRAEAKGVRSFTFDDFRPVGAVLLPFLVTVRAGAKVEWRREEIVLNPPMPADAFARPAPALPPAPLPGYAARVGGRTNLVARGGGSQATESAVEAGLRWLARHQGADGGWHAQAFADACGPDGKCAGEGYGDFDVGETALAVLAFLGAGYTHGSTDAYEDPHAHRQIAFGPCVAKGVAFLRRAQDEEGCVGPRTGEFMYDHALATLALVEAFGSTGADEYRASAVKAVIFLSAAQNPYRGWRYTVKPGDNDTSVTGWCVAALEAAAAAGVPVNGASFEGAKSWLESVTTDDGEVGYNGRGRVDVVVKGKNEAWQPHPTMTAIGLLARISIDRRKDEPLRKQAARVARELPAWDEARHTVDCYYWYHGTTALFAYDGPAGPLWKKWNEAMKSTLVPHQKVAKDGCEDGSWDPAADRWGYAGGRVYATALNVLTLETYYRGPQPFATAPAAPNAPAKRAFLGIKVVDVEGGDGVKIDGVIEGGPAANAGLVVGQRIKRVGDKNVKKMSDLASLVEARKAGDTVDLTVVGADGRESTVTVTLGARSEQGAGD